MPDLHIFKDWDQPEDKLYTTEEVILKYERGYSGVGLDPTQREKESESLRSQVTYPTATKVCDTFGFTDSSKGELIIPFVHVLEAYPLSWPGPGQQVGDCVSHGQKNANLGSMVLEAILGLPDAVTGYIEECPDVSTTGEKNGVLSTEAIYWFRGHAGHGWYCAASAKTSLQGAGAVLRKAYPNADIDLTEYSGRLASKFGRTAPRGVIADAIDDNLFREATEVDDPGAFRDLMGRGFFVNSCGSEGLSKVRDANGVSRRSGSWAHSMGYIGVDDRPWAKQKYGDMLVLVLNSWSIWNKGPRDIHDSAQYVPPSKKEEWENKGIINPATGNIMIPEGSCWVPYKDIRKRYMVAMGGCNGWPRKKLEHWIAPYN